MEEEKKVILHGFWASPYVKGVELALRIKGIPFKYVTEDLKNKSALLLKYNPIYKKVPVLVHNGNPISESLVIIQYIDETWNNNSPSLLPNDPYKRAQIRFWSSFLHQQLFGVTLSIFKTQGEAQERAIEEMSERLTQLEEGLRELIPEGSRFVNGDDLGVLEIVMCSLLGPYKLQQQVFEITWIDSEKHPLIASWLSAMAEHPIVKEATPPSEDTLALLHLVKQNALQSAVA